MVPFDVPPANRVVFGAGRLASLGELTRQCGGERVLIVTDPGIVAAGHVERARESLAQAGLDVQIFSGVEENPAERHVEACAAAARDHAADFLVGLGGGSSMDTAKGANFVLTNGGSIADYWGVGKASRPLLPMIAVPTTAGTGSEAQSFALIANETTHQKMACGDRKCLPRIALLDPEVTVSQPAAVTAVSGIDAVSHALESYVTTRRNPVSRLYSRESWRLLGEWLPRVFADPSDVEARGAVLLGAYFAGCAIESSMLGATHSLANPLTARHGIAHGAAIGLMLPHVLRFNEPVVGEDYRYLAALVPDGAADGALAERIGSLVGSAGLPTQLRSLGIEPEELGDMAREAASQWTAQFNPRPVTVADLEQLYRAAYTGNEVEGRRERRGSR